MTTSSSNYRRYIPPVDYQPSLPSSITSTASAYAYAQQHQLHANKQSNGQSSTASSGSSASLPIQDVKIRRLSPLSDRPHSIEELAKIATAGQLPEAELAPDLKVGLRHSEVYMHQALEDHEAGDIEMAFVNYARAATMVAKRVTSHKQFYNMKAAHREMCELRGDQCLENMEDLKPLVREQFKQWRRQNPNAIQELDLPRILNWMKLRDREERAVRDQAYKVKKAQKKMEAATLAVTGDHTSNQSKLTNQNPLQLATVSQSFRHQPTTTSQTYDTARSMYEEERRRQAEEMQRKKEKEVADEQHRKRAEELKALERSTKDREVTAARIALEEQRQKEAERRREQEGIARRQREVEAAAESRRREIEEIKQREEEGRRREQAEVRRQEQEEVRRREQEEIRRREQEEIRQRDQEETRRREDESRKREEESRKQEQEDIRKREQEEVRKRGQEETRRREEESRKREEEARKQEQEEVRKREQEEIRKREQEEIRKREQEEIRKREQEEIKKREQEEIKKREKEEIRKREQEETRRREEESRNREEEVRKREGDARKREEGARGWEEEETRRHQIEETRKREQEAGARRQRDVQAVAEVARITHREVPNRPHIKPLTGGYSAASDSTGPVAPNTPEGLPVLPLESPTRVNSVKHPRPRHPTIERTRSSLPVAPPITTTSPPPKEAHTSLLHIMSMHQRGQGYAPSLQSMFMVPLPAPPTSLLFAPNHPEGPSTKNYPQSPDRPPAHVRHLYAITHGLEMPQLRPSKDSRILLTDQIQPDEKATLYKPELKIVMVPNDVTTRFLSVAAVNTARNKETCGLLLGKKEGPKFSVTTLLIPRQRGMEHSCVMEEEELITDFTQKRKLITLGWIHTHPTQTCFFTSSDLHIHANFQSMLPEFFAIVCAPKQIPPYAVFRLTDPLGLNHILRCTEKETFHAHDEDISIYTDADKGHVLWVAESLSEIVDLR